MGGFGVQNGDSISVKMVIVSAVLSVIIVGIFWYLGGS